MSLAAPQGGVVGECFRARLNVVAKFGAQALFHRLLFSNRASFSDLSRLGGVDDL